jgi:hypothetical protein
MSRVIVNSQFLLAFGLAFPLAAARVVCSGEVERLSPADSPPVPLVSSYDCRFTEEPVAIDGTLDDAAWKNAVTIDNFSMPWLGKHNKPAAKATRAKILWDRENLYIAADLDDADLYADITEHDGQIWDNDVFEVFLKPAIDKPAYYEFQVNALNTQFDCDLPP